MKKVLAGIGLLFGFVIVGYAGTPLDQGTATPMQGPYSNATIIGSTFTSTSPQVTISVPSCPNNATGRNCLTKELVQLSTGAIFYALDGNTTAQYVQGFGLSGSTTATGENTLSMVEDHLGPLCFTAGNAVTLKVVGTPVSGLNNVVNYEGYTTCGGSNNSGN